MEEKEYYYLSKCRHVSEYCSSHGVVVWMWDVDIVCGGESGGGYNRNKMLGECTVCDERRIVKERNVMVSRRCRNKLVLLERASKKVIR